VTGGEPLALGLVGCGRLAAAGYVPALATSGRFRLVAVADPDPGRSAAIAQLAGDAGVIAQHPDTARLLHDERVDALVVASPVDAHLADASQAAASGVPVLVEKPPAPDAHGAAQLAALSPVPWIGFNRRFDPGARALRARLPSTGEIDVDLSIAYRRRGWSAHVVHDDALLDLGPHLVDWARWLSGAEVVEVLRAWIAPEQAVVELRLDRGRARLTARTDRPHHERIVVRDGEGRRLGHHRLGGPVAAVVGRVQRRPGRLVRSLAAQLDAFAEAAAVGSHPVLATAADGHAVMQVLDAARRCGRRGGAVPVATGVGGS
jgi:YD repeat-containing protein